MQKVKSKNLLELLDDDSKIAVEKYLQIRQSLLLFLGRQEDVFDPEELADESIERVLQKIETGQPIIFEKGKEGAYFFGVAKNVLAEYRRERKRLTPLIELPAHQEPYFNPITEQREFEAWLDKERLLKCVLRGLATLPAPERDLLIEYHRGETGRAAGNNQQKIIRRNLAQRLGINLNALKIRAARIKLKVEEHLDDCLKKSAGG